MIKYKNATLTKISLMGFLVVIATSGSNLWGSGEIGLNLGYRTSELSGQKSTSQNFSGSIGFNLGIFQLYLSHQIVKNQSSFNYNAVEDATVTITETINYTNIGSKLYIPLSLQVLPYFSVGFGIRDQRKVVDFQDDSYKEGKNGPAFNLGMGLKIALTRSFGLEINYATIPNPTKKYEDASSLTKKGSFNFDHIFSAGFTIKMN